MGGRLSIKELEALAAAARQRHEAHGRPHDPALVAERDRLCTQLAYERCPGWPPPSRECLEESILRQRLEAKRRQFKRDWMMIDTSPVPRQTVKIAPGIYLSEMDYSDYVAGI